MGVILLVLLVLVLLVLVLLVLLVTGVKQSQLQVLRLKFDNIPMDIRIPMGITKLRWTI